MISSIIEYNEISTLDGTLVLYGVI